MQIVMGTWTAFAKGARGERRLVLGGLGIIMFALAFGPRNERALFIVDGPDAQAFAALMPTPNPVYAAAYGIGGGDIGPGRSPRGARGLPSGRSVIPGGPAPVAPNFAPTELASVPEDTPGLGFPGSDTPAGTIPGGFPGEVPGLPGTFEPGLPGEGEVVPPIPEPATWLMLMAGFGFIGGALRRRRPRSVEQQRIAGNGDAAHARQDVLS